MNGLTFKKKISLIILSALLSSQAILPYQTFASTATWNPSSGGSGLISGSDLLNPNLIVSVLNCTGIVNKIASAATDLINDGADQLIGLFTDKVKQELVDKAKKQAEEAAAKAAKEGEARAESTAASGGGFSFGSISISPAVFEIIAGISLEQAQTLTTMKVSDDALKKAADDAAKAKIAADKKVAAAKARTQCINGIAVSLAKTELEKMTRSTLNWVGSGFGGDPLFVRNMDSYMNNITNNILKKETDYFARPENAGFYPYGRSYATSSINASRVSTDFDSSVRQTLTNYLSPGATPQSFANNFSQGGWNGWFALTQSPQNNPIGFNMVVSQHTADLQATQKQNAQAEITAGNGYPSQKKCAVFGLTEQRAQSRLSLLQGNITNAQRSVDIAKSELDAASKNYLNGNAIVDNDNAIYVTARDNLASAQAALAAANTDPSNKQCTVWETVTPGSAIRDKVSKTLNSPETQLELVKTIDDVSSALFTALLSRFQNQGLSSLVTKPFDNVSGGLGDNNITDSLGNPVDTGNSYSGFDITKDLAAVIKTQQDFITEATKALKTSGNVLKTLGELDYCIPGPNPNWELNADENVITDTKFIDYKSTVDKSFGTTSPMQTAGTSAYLAMAPSGLAMTKDLSTTAYTISQETSGYQDSITTAHANIKTLQAIKSQVDTIVAAAKARRNADRAKNGLPPVDASCK